MRVGKLFPIIGCRRVPKGFFAEEMGSPPAFAWNLRRGSAEPDGFQKNPKKIKIPRKAVDEKKPI